MTTLLTSQVKKPITAFSNVRELDNQTSYEQATEYTELASTNM
jgi:hypothetical protein